MRTPNDTPGRGFRYVAINSIGLFCSHFYLSKSTLIKKEFAGWRIPWRTIKRKYGIRIVQVRIEQI